KPDEHLSLSLGRRRTRQSAPCWLLRGCERDELATLHGLSPQGQASRSIAGHARASQQKRRAHVRVGEPKPHSHPHEQIAYIISGRMRFHIGQETHDIGPGGLLVIPSNVTRWGEVLGDEPVLNLDVFTPKRPEYVT